MSHDTQLSIDAVAEALDRRSLLSGAVGLAALPALGALGSPGALAHDAQGHRPDLYPGPKPQVAMLVYPDMVMIDLIGPLTVFQMLGFENHLVWKTRDPVRTETGISITPTATFADCPRDLEILFAPGGIRGTTACMRDDAVLSFLADRGASAKWVTSDCTGALIMGAAGLYRGYRATTLWPVMDLLPILGVIPTDERVVFDRNRASGAGATAGIDFALAIGAKIRGEEAAKRAQLVIEYAPQPPFHSGNPKEAAPELVAKVR